MAAGFTPGPDETLMVTEIDEAALTAAVPDGVRLVPVTDPAGADQVAEVHERAFGDDASGLRRLLLDALTATPDTVVAVVALAGDVR
ncbi:GNAT superfamily N-acetyltransferase OS=Streptomyces albaduncus OX=68172 GN=FHS32_001794 PE=4 SV=1 [Streptomyces griseoloalbus]